MAFIKQGDFADNFTILPDKPNKTATEMKVLFGSQPAELKNTLNNALDLLMATTDGASGADNIGVTAINGWTGATVQAMLENSKANIDAALPSASYTAADVLVKIKTVDGTGSGLDADFLDGNEGSHYAPIASPALTGTPTAPTAAAETNTTQVATTAYVFSEILTKALTGLSTVTNAVISATDTVLSAIGKLQAQITANLSTLTTHSSSTFVHRQAINTIQTGSYANAEGNATSASGIYSHAEGYVANASGNYAHAQNNNTIAQGLSQTAIGEYNVAQGTGTSKVTTDNAFIIGKGVSGATANAFRVTWAGAAYGLSAYNSTGADYSEFFEWLDENLGSEDRVGYFVTLTGEKIRKATVSDDYILGIVSATPAIVGDSFNDDWQGRYAIDVWGRRLTHEVIVPAIIEVVDGEPVITVPEHTDTVFVQNPNWNPETPYIARDERPEWATIGLLGKLFVRDDGTCQINGYCKSNDDGVATASTSGYRVMKRIADNIVQVLLK